MGKPIEIFYLHYLHIPNSKHTNINTNGFLVLYTLELTDYENPDFLIKIINSFNKTTCMSFAYDYTVVATYDITSFLIFFI